MVETKYKSFSMVITYEMAIDSEQNYINNRINFT